MTNYTNGDLFQMLLHRLRKDKKGSVNAEEFETFLRWRNMDYFNKQLGVEGITKHNHESLAPFMVFQDDIGISTGTTEHYIILDADYVGPSASRKIASMVNVWWYDGDMVDKIPVDILSSVEWGARRSNSITGPSSSNPISTLGYIVLPVIGNTEILWVEAGADLTSGNIVLDYYAYPNDPYYDYYTDAIGNITYLTEGQGAYTLQTGEESRSGSGAPAAVTSLSVDLEWEDKEAINILDMIVSDVSIALSDPESLQASILERKENVSS